MLLWWLHFHSAHTDLLHALNAELTALVLPPQESESEPEPQPEPDFANAVYNELEVANKFELLKKMEEDLRAEQELVDKSALLMKMLEVCSTCRLNIGRSSRVAYNALLCFTFLVFCRIPHWIRCRWSMSRKTKPQQLQLWQMMTIRSWWKQVYRVLHWDRTSRNVRVIIVVIPGNVTIETAGEFEA